MNCVGNPGSGATTISLPETWRFELRHLMRYVFDARGNVCLVMALLLAGTLGLPALRPVFAHPFADRLPGRGRHAPTATTGRRRGAAARRRGEASGTSGARAAIACPGSDLRTHRRGTGAAEVRERTIDLG